MGKILGLLGLAVLLSVVSLVGTYVHYANYGNKTEKAIEAAYEDNKNVYSTFTQKVREVAQVPEMYTEDLLKVTTAAIEGRYGENGSKAVFQFLKEQNPQLDASLYKNIQQVIESGRNEFKIKQSELIDKKRSYETSLGNVWGGFWLRLAGYPKKDLSEFKIIFNKETQKVFETGVEEAPIKLR